MNRPRSQSPPPTHILKSAGLPTPWRETQRTKPAFDQLGVEVFFQIISDYIGFFYFFVCDITRVVDDALEV